MEPTARTTMSELQCQNYNARTTITGREHQGTVMSTYVRLRKLVYEDQDVYKCKLYGNCDA